MRYYYLDSLRSVLMLLGVFFHAALIFSAEANWRVSSPIKSVHFDTFSNTLHVFRMPAFFIIAGFFSCFSLNRAATPAFLKTRAQRLLIPFACAFIFISTSQTLTTRILAAPRPLDWAKLLHNIMNLNSRTVSHLWFLPHLFAFALLLAGLQALARRIRLTDARRERFQLTWDAFCERGLAIAIMPLASVLMLILKREAKSLMGWDLYGLLDMDHITLYLPFFLFGALLFHSPGFFRSFLRIRAWHLALFAAALWMIIDRDGGKQITFGNCLQAYNRGVLMWVSCMFCFCLFKRFCDRPSPVFTYLSDASYSIYLFHQLFVVLAGAMLLNVPISIYLKYPLIVATGILVPLAIHHFLILRVGVLRLMFNGKWPKKPNGGDGTGKNLASREKQEDAPQTALT